MHGSIRTTRLGHERLRSPRCCGFGGGLQERRSEASSAPRGYDTDEAESRSRFVSPESGQAEVGAGAPIAGHEVGVRFEGWTFFEFGVEPCPIASPSLGAGDILTENDIQLVERVMIGMVGVDDLDCLRRRDAGCPSEELGERHLEDVGYVRHDEAVSAKLGNTLDVAHRDEQRPFEVARHLLDERVQVGLIAVDPYEGPVVGPGVGRRTCGDTPVGSDPAPPVHTAEEGIAMLHLIDGRSGDVDELGEVAGEPFGGARGHASTCSDRRQWR